MQKKRNLDKTWWRRREKYRKSAEILFTESSRIILKFDCESRDTSTNEFNE